MTIRSDWQKHPLFAALLFTQLDVSQGEIQSAQGDAVFNVEVEDTETVITFDEDCNLTFYFKNPSTTTCFLSWAVTTVPTGTGEEVASSCGAQVDEVSEEDDDQDTLYLKNIPPGPNVPLLIGCSIPLKGKTFRVPHKALMESDLFFSLESSV